MTTENALASEDAPETVAVPEKGAEKDETANLQAEKEQDTDTSAEKEEAGKSDAEKADPEADKSQPKKAKASDRIKQVIDQRNAAEKRVAELEKKLARYEADNGPDPDKFNSDAEYQRALAAHTAKSMRRADIEEDIKETREQINNDRREAWQERVSEFASTVQDFEQVAYRAPISDQVSELILDSDFGPQIAYALGKDPARAREISAMPLSKAALAIGRMEAEMAPKPKKISNAPPPVETVGSRGPSSEKDPSKMTMDEYVKWRNSGGG